MIIDKMSKFIILFLFLNILFNSNLNASNHNFDLWIQDFKKRAIAEGISYKVVNELMDNAKFLPKVIEYDRYQPEFYEDTFTYIKKRSSKKKVKQGVQLYKKEICNLEKLHHFFDEKSIYWQDDLDHVSSMILKTLKSITKDQELEILPLWKEDEYEFTQNLFRKAVLQKEENDAVLQTYSKNWEKERLATMDSLLMNLAMTEALEFSSIPIKVTLNEYIEISKFYSTPKSNSFITVSYTHLRAHET